MLRDLRGELTQVWRNRFALQRGLEMRQRQELLSGGTFTELSRDEFSHVSNLREEENV